MSKVMFTSRRPYGRAENITAVFDAYDGEKEFIQEKWGAPDPRIFNCDVMVADEFVPWSPGRLIMIGHGISGGKSYGMLQPYGYHNARDAMLIDWVVCTSEATIPLEANQYGVPLEKVLPLGMPRTDRYFGVRKGDGKTILAGKRAYLFAPTFRNANEPRRPWIDWHHIDDLLTDDEILAVKPHMVTRHILEGEYKHIVEISSETSSGPYLIDCDVLITDYSTIMLDAHVLGKPVVLFEKEHGFARKRGMWLPYPEGYASRFSINEDELIREIRSAKYPQEADLRCLELTAGACDGHSTERVVRLLKNVVEEIS